MAGADYVTKNEMKELADSIDKKIDKAVGDLSQVIQTFAQNVDSRFDAVDKRLNGVEQRLDGVDKRLDGVEFQLVSVNQRLDNLESGVGELNKKYDHLISTIDHFLKRLDDIESDNTARDAHLARLERWIEQIANKTGVKLEN